MDKMIKMEYDSLFYNVNLLIEEIFVELNIPYAEPERGKFYFENKIDEDFPYSVLIGFSTTKIFREDKLILEIVHYNRPLDRFRRIFKSTVQTLYSESEN